MGRLEGTLKKKFMFGWGVNPPAVEIMNQTCVRGKKMYNDLQIRNTTAKPKAVNSPTSPPPPHLFPGNTVLSYCL